MLYNVLKIPLQFDDEFDDYFPEEENTLLSTPEEINDLNDAFIPKTIQNCNSFYVKFSKKNRIRLQNPFEKKSNIFQTPIILNFPMLKLQLCPFYKRYALSNLLIENPKITRSVNVFFTFYDPNKIRKPIVFKKCGTFIRIAVRSMDYYFRYCPNWLTFQSSIEYDHGRIRYFSRMYCKHKEFITKGRFRSMEHNYFNTFVCLNENSNNIEDNFQPEKWRITPVPITKCNIWNEIDYADYYFSWDYFNKLWSINTLYIIFYIEKHTRDNPQLLEIMIKNVRNADFLPQVKAFLQEIYVEDISIKPSPS
jgi:hypothetical protein